MGEVTGQFTVYHPRFWHCQYMKSAKARHWCHDRQEGIFRNRDLRPQDVKLIMDYEGNETNYLKFEPDPAAGGRVPPDEYFKRGTWYFRQGHVVTLAEMFRFGVRVCSCFDIYRTWVHLPIFAYRRFHSASRSTEGQQRRDAKKFHYKETGRYGLPDEPW